MSHQSTDQTNPALEPHSSARISPFGFVAIALVFAVGILYQFTVPTGSDVSWLIVVAERVFDGQRLYVDIIESNPPMAVFIYLPAVVVERLTGISAESAEILLTGLVAAVSLGLSAMLISCARLTIALERFVFFGIFVLVILPRLAFSQREHLALLLMLPAVTMIAARAAGLKASVLLSIGIGVAAGLGVSLKPQFAAALVIPAIAVTLTTRSLKPLFRLENLVAAAVALILVGVVLVAFPAYVAEVVPMEAATYLYERLPLIDMGLQPPLLALIVAGGVTAWLCRKGPDRVVTDTYLLAAVGFGIAFVVQAKGWRYQLYPAAALVFLAFLVEILPRLGAVLALQQPGRSRYARAIALVIALVCLVPLINLCNITGAISLPLAAEIKALAPHPRVLALSTDPAIGHPLTRVVGGIWTSKVSGQLITRSANYRLANFASDYTIRADMAHWIDWDRDRIAEALRTGKPDAIVIDTATFDLPHLLDARPDIATMFAHYHKISEANGVELYVPNSLSRPSSGAEQTR